MESVLNVYSAFTANNARMLDPASIARLFVPPPFFRDLFTLRNQLLIGPRGSGKTTLLKMLRIPSIAAWTGKDGEWARQTLPFVGIFLPADVSWTGRLNAQASSLPEGLQVSYVRAALSLMLVRAIVETFIERNCVTVDRNGTSSAALHSINLSTHDEVRLCERLTSQWKIRTEVPTLRGLKSAISAELVGLRQELDRARQSGNLQQVEDLCNRLNMPFVDTVVNAVDLFEEHVDSQEVKWALLIDELEIAPDWLQRELLACLRSTDQRLLFKLAITPCGVAANYLGGVTQPHRGDDYDEIPLWYGERREAIRFCEAFWFKLLEVRGLPPISPNLVFGDSLADEFEPTSAVAVSGRYARDGVWYRALQSLARKDASFLEYLDRRGVKLSDVRTIDRAQMDSVLRKVAPIAVFRDYFLPAKGRPDQARLLRSRKLVSLYSGAKNIFGVTEGNPRWYLSLVGQLLTLWERQNRTISREQQAKAITAFSDRFLATIAAYPNPINASQAETAVSEKLTVTALIEKIGQAAFSEIVSRKFMDDPRTTVRVDVEDLRLDSLLNVAVNAGALVLLGGDQAGHLVSSPYRHIVRLSYHLAPKFKIPLRSGRHQPISRILGVKPRSRVELDAQVQMDFEG